MENVLRGIPSVLVRVDDILVTGKTDAEHRSNVRLVLKRLGQAGLKVKLPKCKFFRPSVVYMGHQVDSVGIHPTADKVEAIHQAPAPANRAQLRCYLGLLNFYRKFIPSLSTIIEPLNQLLSERQRWTWTSQQQTAFDKSKELLCSDTVLVHYDSDKPLVLSCDASPYGVGAVLAHYGPDGQVRPVAFASRTLNDTE